MHKTALYDDHVKLGARMTEFAGWQMPLYYTSILEEHQAVRQAAGMFDVSHMGQVLVTGADALATLNELVVSNLAEVGANRACYTLLTNERGGIVDDLIIYRLGEQMFLVIVNSANRAKDVEWLVMHRKPQTEIHHISDGRGILAVQGPKAEPMLQEALGVELGGLARFSLKALDRLGPRAWIARTGYTGSAGFELFLPDASLVRLWSRLLERAASDGLQPAGLGARDTLRLEAGLRLYGTDMDEATTPYEADLGWTVATHKPSFLGRDVLATQKAQGVAKKLVGLTMGQGPVMRHGCAIESGGRAVGTITSGTFSPLLSQTIGFGYVETALAVPGTVVDVVIRNTRHQAVVTKLPFWKPEPGTPVSPSTARSATA